MEQQTAVTHVRMPVDLMNKTLDHLATRPLGEVFDLFLMLKGTADASFAEQGANSTTPDGPLEIPAQLSATPPAVPAVTHVQMPAGLMSRTLDYLVPPPLRGAVDLFMLIKSNADASVAEQSAGGANPTSA